MTKPKITKILRLRKVGKLGVTLDKLRNKSSKPTRYAPLPVERRQGLRYAL